MRLLKTLDLSNNDLSDLPSELGILPKLTRINIEGNPMKTIKSSMRTAGAEVLKKYLVTRISGILLI
jgi:Leucine-rich repeat (LRR) protein